MLTYITNECMPLEKMLARVQKHHPGDGCLLVKKAYEFAENAHRGQVRKSGEPYFIHPVSVASILTDLMIDAPTIAAGFLHDTVEDCKDITLDTIRTEFGEEVAQLVDGVTKLDKLDFTNREEQKAESLRKMILAMSKDIRVVIIKLADRLHNMRTLRFQPEERQKAIAHETLDIYAPLAHRLGMNSIKSELEDLSFKYIDPEAFHDIAQKVGLRRTEREENIRMVISELSEKLDAQHIHYEMDGRPKHLYSIYKKMKGQGKTFDQIYDLIAVRVLVDTVQDCYTVLGIVHTLWNQIPGRFKDYISVPKGNMYQSLHTTVIGGRKMPFPFEIQIRTWEMHRVAEFGVAAHWRYKEGGTGGGDLDNKLYWLRQILDWQGDTRDSQEFIDSLKTDLFSEEVLLFTPKGDIVSMQRGATPIDFAYRIHSGVGNHCVGAKVNGRIVPLETELETGDSGGDHHLAFLQRTQHRLAARGQDPAGQGQDPPVPQARAARRKRHQGPRHAGKGGQAPRRGALGADQAGILRGDSQALRLFRAQRHLRRGGLRRHRQRLCDQPPAGGAAQDRDPRAAQGAGGFPRGGAEPSGQAHPRRLRQG